MLKKRKFFSPLPSPHSSVDKEAHNNCLIYPNGQPSFKHGPILKINKEKTPIVSELDKFIFQLKKILQEGKNNETLQSSILNIISSAENKKAINIFHSYASLNDGDPSVEST